MATTKKRQRSENWLEEDKIMLKELVRERVGIIENKNTDTNSNSAKVSAWNELRESFNAMCKGAQRTVSQLKAQWSLLKISAKKLKATERKELYKTGGGPPVTIKEINSEDISSWLPNEFIVDINEFDSDQITILPPAKPTTAVAGHSEKMILPPAEPTTAVAGHSEEMIVPPAEPTTAVAGHSEEMTSTSSVHSGSGSLRNVKKKMKNKPTPAEEIAESEIMCRKELHKIQMENERQRGENLRLKAMVLKEKLK